MANREGGMQCPVDNTALVMSERSGIEIDYCPTCRGVWLDRGELDKIIERGAAQMAPPPPPSPAPPPRMEPERQGSRWSDSGQGYQQDYRSQGHHKRKKSFLDDIFG